MPTACRGGRARRAARRGRERPPPYGPCPHRLRAGTVVRPRAAHRLPSRTRLGPRQRLRPPRARTRPRHHSPGVGRSPPRMNYGTVRPPAVPFDAAGIATAGRARVSGRSRRVSEHRRRRSPGPCAPVPAGARDPRDPTGPTGLPEEPAGPWSKRAVSPRLEEGRPLVGGLWGQGSERSASMAAEGEGLAARPRSVRRPARRRRPVGRALPCRVSAPPPSRA